MHGRLDKGEQIPGSVVDLTREQQYVVIHSFSLGDVAGDFGCAHDCTCTVLDRRDRQRKMNWAPVSAGADSVIMLDALSLLNARKNSGLLFAPAWWNYQEYRFAHDFFGCIAIDSLCTRVSRGHGPVEADADDCIVTGFHNGSEPPG